MSIRAWGAFEIKGKAAYHEKVEFSFQTVKIANQNQLGIKLGSNVSREFRKEYLAESGFIPFELTENPLSNVAEYLFIPDGVAVTVNKVRTDEGESLESRISRVQNFLYEILNIERVIDIVLHVDGGFGEESEEIINVSDFKTRIISMFEGEFLWTPTVKFIISK